MGEMGKQLGVSITAVSHWEGGLSVPDSYSAIAFAQKFKVSIDWLLLGKK